MQQITEDRKEEIQQESPVHVEDVLPEGDSGPKSDDELILSRAHHLLRLAEAGTDPDANYTQAVNGLIKASRNGNHEATQLLQKHLDEGKGNNNVCLVFWKCYLSYLGQLSFILG